MPSNGNAVSFLNSFSHDHDSQLDHYIKTMSNLTIFKPIGFVLVDEKKSLNKKRVGVFLKNTNESVNTFNIFSFVFIEFIVP